VAYGKDMTNQLLWIEVITDGSLGLLLLSTPMLLNAALGLPHAGSSLWPRLFGGALLGIAIATAAGIAGWTKSGLGLGGHVAVNITIALTVLSMLVLGPTAPTRRGRGFLWLLALALLALAFVEIAHAT
jgi:hypothetical protein